MALETLSGPASESNSPESVTTYHRLERSRTRFLTVFPAPSLDDEIYSELKCVSLDDGAISGYEALSYTWDSKEFTQSIWVNNSQLKVTSNLYEALRHLRWKEKKRTVWIDAVCINQEDKMERSQQVLYMGKIYSSVHRVIIWLGKEAEGGDLGIRRLADGFDGLPGEIRAAAGTLFQRPWWFRTWTIQEFLKSRDSIFLCGSIMFSWDQMVKIMDRCLEDGFTGQNIDVAYNYYRSKNSHKGDILRSVMIDFGHSQASDPRDKVYAFLGIAKDGHEITPDYRASVQQVYTDVVKAYIKKEGNLEIICTHHRGYNLLCLPSWVPDWSISRAVTQNWTVNRHGESLYSAGYPLQATPSNSTGRLRSPSVSGISFEGLHAFKGSGITIGLITEMAHSIDPELFNTNDWIQAIRSWKPEAIESGKYINGETNFRAFCRTLIADANDVVRTSFFDFDPSFLEKLEKRFHVLIDLSPGSIASQKRTPFVDSIRRATYRSRFSRISSGYMALVPDASQIGDEICILLGCSTPMVLRREPASLADDSIAGKAHTTHRMIGPCYVHGVMDGEFFTEISETFTFR